MLELVNNFNKRSEYDKLDNVDTFNQFIPNRRFRDDG